MGILDDAIREHLDLKKKHGAPDEEVSRQEAEALGPARREVAFEPPAETADEPILGHAEALPVEHHPEFVADPVEEELHADPHVHPDPDAPPPPPPPEAAAPPPSPPVFPDEDPHAPPPPVPGFEPEGDPLATQPLDTQPLEPAELPDSALPTDRRATQHLEAIQEGDAPPPDDADVLEETPDFLQETPEHDRLWFEQKPPRDFDFDD
jgi:hypothetical protein